MRILITGGAGYIGSHIALQALVQGHKVMIFDDLSNSGPGLVSFLGSRGAWIVKGDILDRALLTDSMRKFRPDLTIHAAGLKDASESEEIPLQYYERNVNGTVTVLQAMLDSGMDRLVFSSSAAVYGESRFPVSENSPVKPTSAYGRSKMMAEEMVADFAQRGKTAITLRYFNPIAAHLLLPQYRSNTFMSMLTGAAAGRVRSLPIFNNGENVRDFIHVSDLAEVHFRLEGLTGHHVFNVGSGKGYKIGTIVEYMEKVINRDIPKTMVDLKRTGDLEYSVSNSGAIKAATGWEARRTMDQMCRDAWEAETLRLSSEQ
jgi:UDP-glucose 4-epimerase